MAMFYEIESLLHAPIEDLLNRLYPATILKWLYETSLGKLVEANPNTLPQPDRPRSSARDKAPKKAYLVSLMLAVLRDQTIGRRLFEALPPTSRDALAAVTWARRANLAALEKTLGQPIVAANPDQRREYYEPFLLPPEHGLLCVLRNPDNQWSYYSRQGRPKKEDYCLVLPDAMRKVFKAFVPPPVGYDLLPLDRVPAPAEHCYSCVQKVVADLRLVAEFIAQGHLKYTKSEQVAMPSLKILHQMTGGPEFFENSEDSTLALLRTRLLVGGMAFAGDKEREKLLARADSAEPVRELVEKVLARASFLHEELLDHLTGSRNRWYQYSPRAVKNLALFFGILPAGKWVSWENMSSYHVLREDLPSLFDRCTGLQVHATSDRESWSTIASVGAHNEFELVGEPLLKGFAFLLAAFGMAEIAYASPTRTTYHRPKKPYLTPFAGLGFVRLTPLGEFVFRQRDLYEIASPPPTRSPIILDDTRLLATCRNADKLTQLALGQFMEPLATGRYRMTPKSFLGGCGSREDIEERIRLFRRVVSAAPPAVWEEFIQRILARIAPLCLEPDYVVLKLSAEDEISRLFASDSVLRETVLKVEGLRIAVRRDDLKKLAKRLEQFGYLSPIPRLT